ncbi:hypothetical protein M422DRAFT_65033 [Sphaerobolus stellatus SS14]|nr:hypothetical protein M422DRAFT_65033 [Sphaerobolus stellatus SS14]
MANQLLTDVLFIVLCGLAAAASWWQFRRHQIPKSVPIHKHRQPGEWPPVQFCYPHFEPWLDFHVHNTKPIPYRPFRWGIYPINMAIRAMRWESWIELDKHYLEYLEIRKARVASRGDKVVQTLPGADRAALEACTELASYLAKRYPSVFRVHRVYDKGGLGQGDSIAGKDGGRVKTVEIIPTGDKWDLDVDDPMTVAGLLADDLAVMMEGPDGLYYLRAGSICVPGSWRIVDKIGLPLEEIHTRGNVYKYKEKLQFSMDRFFSKLPVDKPVERNNYSFQLGPSLDWLYNHNGDEDDFDQSTKIPRPDTESIKHFKPIEPTIDMSNVYFRSERQTLRRLPITGCILFTIRTYLHPVTEIVQEPGVPGRLASAIRSWDEAIARRKDKDLYADTMLPWLDKLHQEQIDAGITGADKSGHYPF